MASVRNTHSMVRVEELGLSSRIPTDMGNVNQTILFANANCRKYLQGRVYVNRESQHGRMSSGPNVALQLHRRTKHLAGGRPPTYVNE